MLTYVNECKQTTPSGYSNGSLYTFKQPGYQLKLIKKSLNPTLTLIEVVQMERCDMAD